MHTDHDTSQRSTMLTIMLGVMAAVFFGLVLVVLTGGMIFQVLGVVGFIALVGVMHYLWWGRALTEETAGEREEEELLRRAEEPDERFRL